MQPLFGETKLPAIVKVDSDAVTGFKFTRKN
jgi:hypothetical protein